MQLSNTDLRYLRDFVEQVLAVCEASEWEDTGVGIELEDMALNAALILGVKWTPEDSDE